MSYSSNCYNDEKLQRFAFVSSNLLFTNENINVQSGPNFQLSSCNSRQITFGETPSNTVGVSLFNDGGLVMTDFNNEFSCYAGVEDYRRNNQTFSNTISYISHDGENVQLLSVSPYIITNCEFTSISSYATNGYPCKMLWFDESLYMVFENGSTRYYVKHNRLAPGSYSGPSGCNDYEEALLDRIYDNSSFVSLVINGKGFAEFYITTASGEATDEETWGDVRSMTWDDISDRKWSDYASYSTVSEIHYETKAYGVWKFDRPKRINDAILTLTGRDRMRFFEEDSLRFVKYARTLRWGRMSVRNYIKAIAEYKNVPVGSLTSLGSLADEIQVDPKVYYNQKSLKDMLSYAFEVGAANAIIDRDGCLAASSSIIAYNDIPYMYTLDVSDDTTPTIETALVFLQGDEAVYEGDASAVARYEWSDNPFFNKRHPVASYFQNGWQIKYGGYRETILTSDADYSAWSDSVMAYEVGNIVYMFPVFTLNVVWNGHGKATYSAYGGNKREYQNYNQRVTSVSNTNDTNIQGLNQAQYNGKVSFDADGMTINSQGLRIKNGAGQVVFDADTDGNLVIKGHLDGATGTFSGQLDAASGQFTGEIIADSGTIGNWVIEDNKLVCHASNNRETKIEMGRNNQSGSPHIYLVGQETLAGVDRVISSRLGYTGRNFFEDGEIKVAVNYNHIPSHTPWFKIHTVDTIMDLQSNTSINILANTTTLDKPVNSSEPSTLEIKNDLVKISNPFWVDNVASTTSGSNTVLVSGTYGRKLYVTSSLRKLKDHIKTIENPTEKVDNLRGVSFTSKCEVDDPNRVFYGLIAEEVEKAVPELATYEDGKLQSVQYDRVCALLIEDNKAMHKRLKDMEARLDALESMIKELKK